MYYKKIWPQPDFFVSKTSNRVSYLLRYNKI